MGAWWQNLIKNFPQSSSQGAWQANAKAWRWALLISLGIILGTILLANQHIDLKALWLQMAYFGENHPVWFGLIIFGTLLTLGFVSIIPGGTVLIIGTASVINPWVTLVIALVAEVLGSFGMFLVATRLFGQGSRPPPRFAMRLRIGYEQHPLSYTLLVRVIPFLPPGGVTFALAWLRCPKWIFMLAGTIATIPFLYLDVSLGAGIGKGMKMAVPSWKTLLLSQQVWLPLIGLAALCLLPIIWQAINKKLRKRISVD